MTPNVSKYPCHYYEVFVKETALFHFNSLIIIKLTYILGHMWSMYATQLKMR